jgi:hypothetical protein
VSGGSKMGTDNAFVYFIEDETHSVHIAQKNTFLEALRAIEEYSKLKWDEPPNKCPCRSWKTCHRKYTIIEGRTIDGKWSHISTTPICDVSANGVFWHYTERKNEIVPTKIEIRSSD